MSDLSSNPMVSGQRLDSWKEIAAFLGKGERTVKRWERERGLPVRRVPGRGKASVYAFSGELDDWLKSHASQKDELSDPDYGDGVGNARLLASAVPTTNSRAADELPAPVEARTKTVYPPAIWVAAVFVVIIATGFIALARQQKVPAISASPAHSTTAARVTSPEAASLYLKGRFEWSKRTPESLTRAVDYFTQAIVQDPGYAQAYAGLADTYSLFREYTNMPDSEAFPRALAAAKKAVALDDSLAEAHRALAFDLFNWSWNFTGAEAEFRRAIELNPQDAVSHHWFATSLMVLGRFTESIAEIQRARELDPSSNTILADEAVILYYAREGAESKSLLKQVEAADPDFLAPHHYLAFIAFQTRDYATYVEESRKMAEMTNDRPGLAIAAAAKAGYAGGDANKMLRNIYRVEKQNYQQDRTSGMALAETCVLLGKKEEAIGYLEENFSKHSASLLWMRLNPTFDALSGEPRFRDLVVRIGLPPVRKAGG